MTNTSPPRNGAEVMRDTLIDCGVTTCFANPGTSEMHFVAALDHEPRIRCVLGLEENVVTGAADGFGRMTDRPAVTLLHLGPGLANGAANLHNARRARSPILNVVGDHASGHLDLDAPLTSDVEGIARPVSDFVRRVRGAGDVQAATVEAFEAASGLPGVATLILPADAAWGHSFPAKRAQVASARPPDGAAVEEVLRALQRAQHDGRSVAFLLTGHALRQEGLEMAGLIAARFDARLLCETLVARHQRGAGTVEVEKIPYPVPQALECLRSVGLLVLVGAKAPVAFFAYPGLPGRLTGPDTAVVSLCGPGENPVGPLTALASMAAGEPRLVARTDRASVTLAAAPDTLSPDWVCASVAAHLPEQAIVCDESLSAMRLLYDSTRCAAAHDYLQNTGGAIGIGPTLAVGAAVACPDRKVINVQADGSAMYTIQALWTQARERLNVLTIILSNRAYKILHHEMRGVGVQTLGANSRQMLNLDDPEIDFALLARGMGVEAVRVRSGAQLDEALRRGLASPGPFLIDAILE
jgi:acetolactate synthase I/II/III large subunit